jgi:HPt (histidine-containing phosphotransfer) domain-containing protein
VSALEAELEALRAEYRADLPRRLARIEALAAAASRAELARELHSLAGSAATFGLPRVGDAARAAEEHVSRFGAGDAKLAPLLEALRHTACSA